MPRPAIKARFMISSLWINNCGARERPREANVPAMPGKKTIQNEQLAARGNAPRVSFANENRGRKFDHALSTIGAARDLDGDLIVARGRSATCEVVHTK